jgi:DEAD/DEAH box helicase domain-containing protein
LETKSVIERFLQNLEQDAEVHHLIRHRDFLPPCPAVFGDLDPPLPPLVHQVLARQGISRLFSHQAAAIDHVRTGRNVVVVTPTASGKTLTYFLPILESLLKISDESALLLFPLKALEQDQRAKIQWWQETLTQQYKLTCEVFDGDTPKSRRAAIKRNPPQFLISNPDMLHQGILAYHQGWEKLFRRLKWIVVDEMHAYRGIFGSHILQVFRRLSRLLTYHGLHPQFICLSATIANPLELAQTLTNQTFELISESGAPTVGRHVVFCDTQAALSSSVAKMFVRALDSGLKTIVFTKARVATEIIHHIIMDTRPDLAPLISSYRAGFLPEERREIERKLAAGELRGVVSTSALELGIDIGGLDVCILSGYPGSMMSFWQRAGRAGRRGQASAIIMMAGYDALDQYFLANPQELLTRSVEAALVNESNEEILRSHLPSAAAEIPLMHNDPHINVQQHEPIISQLEREGLLIKSASGKQWFPGSRRPHANVNLRNIGGTFEIIPIGGKRAIGDISGGAVFRECHQGAIYLHCGEQYHVEELDLEKKQVHVQAVESSVYTMVRSDKQTEIIDDRAGKRVRSFEVHIGKVKVTETFHSYERRRIYSQELLSVEKLDLPPQSYVTNGVWLVLPKGLGDDLAASDLHFMGGIHAVEHATISLIPLFCLCDRNDVGGISFTHHKQLEDGAIFFYDGYPGGAGIAERVYDVVEELLERTHRLISQCGCEVGCPSCIQSPKCGAGNKPLDKIAAIRTLQQLLFGESVSRDEATVLNRVSQPIMPPVEPWIPREIPLDKRVLVFDLETQKAADEVGGWSEARQMRLAVAAVWDSREDRITTFGESQVEELIACLKAADLVVGYNVQRFDYEVLRGYTFEPLQHLPTLDLLKIIEESLGRRLKLDTVASATLGASKSADGLQSLAWFKEGRLDLVTEYCIHDVEITRDLLKFVLQNGYVLYDRKDMGVVRVPLAVDWDKFVHEPSVNAA